MVTCDGVREIITITMLIQQVVATMRHAYGCGLAYGKYQAWRGGTYDRQRTDIHLSVREDVMYPSHQHNMFFAISPHVIFHCFIQSDTDT